MGRKKTPTETLKRRGSKQVYERNKDEPRPDRDKPECPDWVVPRVRADWDDTCHELMKLGLCAVFYQTEIAMMLNAKAHYLDMLDITQADGFEPILTGENGGMYQHPAVGMRRTALADLAKHTQRFGMNPSAIADVRPIPKAGQTVNAKERFVRRRKEATS